MNRTPVPSRYQDPNTATERQVAFIHDLMDRKNLFACPSWFDTVNAMDEGEYKQHIARVKEQVKTVTKQRASQIIDTLKALPDEVSEPQSPPVYTNDVEAGRYAVAMPHPDYDEPQTKFFRVDRPTEGRWAGYTFVNEQASDEHWPVKGDRKREVLAKIAAEPDEAMARYGQLLGHCGRCGRTLTDPLSRELGIGPVCRGL